MLRQINLCIPEDLCIFLRCKRILDFVWHWPARQAQLKAWADILDPPEDPSGGGGGGGGEGAPPSLDDNDFEFMLKVMKMIQTEQDIRARTRALEQLKRTLHLQDLRE